MFNNLSKKQRAVAEYLYDRRGHLVSYNELLRNVWPEYPQADQSEAKYRRVVHLVVQKIRRTLPTDWIRTCGKQGYMWAGATMVDNGHDIREAILSSSKAFDGPITIVRLLKLADQGVIQLRQTEGNKAQFINLDMTEFNNLSLFIQANY